MSDLADRLIERLLAAGTRAVFGLPGGAGNLDLVEAAGRAGLPFILTSTEAGSAIAAIAQAEITRAPGACITTLGPGAASVVNGVACAKLDRAPLLVMTDRHPSNADAFEHQRIDHRALLAPVTKWSGSLAPPNAGDQIDHAFARLAELPPGPVHLDCPGDFADGQYGGSLGAQRYEWNEAFDTPEFQALITSSRKPLLILGLAARRLEIVQSVRALCEARGVPALVTYKAKGILADAHECFAGVFTHGALERGIVDESDLLIGVGFDPVEILPRPWAYRQAIVSIAPWQMADDHVPFLSQQIGHVDLAIDELSRKFKTIEWDRALVQSTADAARAAVATAGGIRARVMTAQDVVAVTAARFAGRARVAVDAGAHMFPATTLWPVREPNELLISNGLSTMGFALPAAIGAALLDRPKPVVALTGDGGLLICLGELATVARERLRIVIVVFKDSSLSLIEIKQQQRKLAPAAVALGDLDWIRIAEGFGIQAWSAGTTTELEAALESAASADGPVLIEARIDRSNYGATMKVVRG